MTIIDMNTVVLAMTLMTVMTMIVTFYVFLSGRSSGPGEHCMPVMIIMIVFMMVTVMMVPILVMYVFEPIVVGYVVGVNRMTVVGVVGVGAVTLNLRDLDSRSCRVFQVLEG